MLSFIFCSRDKINFSKLNMNKLIIKIILTDLYILRLKDLYGPKECNTTFKGVSQM